MDDQIKKKQSQRQLRRLITSETLLENIPIAYRMVDYSTLEYEAPKPPKKITSIFHNTNSYEVYAHYKHISKIVQPLQKDDSK